MNQEISSIVIQLKKGDYRAFEKLYNLYWNKVYHFTQLYIYNAQETSDIVQDVFVKLWEKRELLNEKKSLEGFLFITTRNIIFNQKRAHFKEVFLKETAIQAVENMVDSSENYFEVEDLKRFIDQLISLLPPKRRQVFMMSRNEHLKNSEIAEKLSITEKAVERNISFALKFLKKNLKSSNLLGSIHYTS